MPAVDVQDSSFVKKGKVRLILMGKPNSRKTSSFPSFPSPKVISGCPGEKHTAILTPSVDMKVRIWEGDGNPRTTYQEYLAETQNILTGKVLPGAQCVIFDGMHKVMVIAPINPQHQETDQVTQKYRPQLFQCMPAGIMGNF